MQENLGPSEEAEAEFVKELAKMVTDTSTESRKVDKKTALALWDSAVIPPNIRKKKADELDEDDASEINSHDVMAFTVITKRGNKQHVRFLVLPPLRPPINVYPDTPIGGACYISLGRTYSFRTATR